ncbi:DUF7002 family protein [Paenibacillus chibensis]|uniref:DUF7002 family protein n=1 Tax=Paenibacillus chibensis TaxID=59846 RepID=UPI000FDAD804|nr:hypothetical protein [Paenibacillus chibensis]MEC0370223.1 hypothetical protein [Paenibacillus chibensis]
MTMKKDIKNADNPADVRMEIVASVTPTAGRRTLYHFTRLSNLTAIAASDSLVSSGSMSPYPAGERRTSPMKVRYDRHLITINAHLCIPESMLEPDFTLEQFRAYLDRHVFFWPTRRDCQKMLSTYTRREPEEKFAVLSFDAASLLLDHYDAVKLSKYDSGSSPRYPKHCSYKKSPNMFVDLDHYKIKVNGNVPTKASEIREVLIENRLTASQASYRPFILMTAGMCQAAGALCLSLFPDCWEVKRDGSMK